MTQQNSRCNPYLFVCGVPRSGTTLLQRMLDHHPDLVVANDTHFIPRALEIMDDRLLAAARSGQPVALTKDLASITRQYHRFFRLGLAPEAISQAEARSATYQQFVQEIYDALARKHAKPLAGEKTPDYLRRLDVLNGLFPMAKVIHLIRDGRNVALSLMEWAHESKGPGRLGLWQKQPVAVCALWWRWMTLKARRDTMRLGSSIVHEIRYEELIRSPREILSNACRFLGLQFSPTMLDFHKGKSKGNESLSAKSAWLPPKPGLRDWQNEMTPFQVELFESLAGDALLELGYHPSKEATSEKVNPIAAECRDWWNRCFVPRHPDAATQTGAACACR